MDQSRLLENLAEDLQQYRAVYFYGAAGLGKTAFISKFIPFWKKRGHICTYLSAEEDADSIWQTALPDCIFQEKEDLLILDQFEHIHQPALRKKLADALWGSSEKQAVHPDGSKGRAVLFISRTPVPEDMFHFLWEKTMKECPGNFLLLGHKEIAALAADRKLYLSQKETNILYELSGGIYALVCIILYLSEQIETPPVDIWKTGHPMLLDYVEKNIWSTLPERHQKLCKEMVYIPILNQCLNATPASYDLADLEKLGVIRRSRNGEYCFPGLLWRYIELREKPSGEPTARAVMLGDRHFGQGCYKEALACYLYGGDRKKHRTCLLRSYEGIFREMEPDIFHRHLEFSLGDSVEEPEGLFLWGMYALQTGDFAKAGEYLEKLKKRYNLETNRRRFIGELYVNLLYYMPDVPIAEWLELAYEIGLDIGAVRLFSFHNGRPESLCAVKDCSDLFIGKEKEIREYRKKWQETMVKEQWYCFNLAEAEFRMGTNRQEEAFRELAPLLVIEEDMDREKMAALFGALCSLYMRGYTIPQGIENLMGKYYVRLSVDRSQLIRQNVRALNVILKVWKKDTEEAVHWMATDPISDYRPIHRQNFYLYLQRARNCIYGQQYERAAMLYERLATVAAGYREYRMRTEALVGQAVAEYAMENTGAALKTMTMAMALGKHYRYVGLFCMFGDVGEKLFQEYMNMGTRWKENAVHLQGRKKSYYYGNVIGSSYENYLKVLTREIHRNAKKCPQIEIKTESAAEALTATEKLVLNYIAKGYSNSEIAEKMNIRITTVKKHIYIIYRKLDVSSRTQAILKGKSLGLLSG